VMAPIDMGPMSAVVKGKLERRGNPDRAQSWSALGQPSERSSICRF